MIIQPDIVQGGLQGLADRARAERAYDADLMHKIFGELFRARWDTLEMRWIEENALCAPED